MSPFELDGANPWLTTTTRVVFDNGRLRLRDDSVVQPDGHPGRYAYLEVTSPVVAVVPVDDDMQVYLVRQWRYPWRRNSWEIPSGGGEDGEAPIDAAKRELAEEVGMDAIEWQSLGGGYSSATIDSHWHFFMARGLRLRPPGQAVTKDGAEHDLIVGRVPFQEAVAAAMDGRIAHGMSVVGLLRAARRFGI
jgi:8-oxo-dGTP pyrophosphatase MutT (NUDIX family)